MFYQLRGSIFASFLFFCSQVFASGAEENGSGDDIQALASTPQWQALIQANGGMARITDPRFLLSHQHFSAENELRQSVALLRQKPESACRFPARKLFIERQLNIRLSDFRLDQCADYQQFKSYAPADTISLIYTSENLTQASSMMGHIMLRIEGQNIQGQYVQHAVSFFTELQSVNAAKILWESLYVGKQGFFKVSPYEEHIEEYLSKEQRNVWEYQLNLSPEVLALLHAHLWELKAADIPYFFHRYNCATLTQLILAVASPQMSPGAQEWVTPLDVVKKSQQFELISNRVIVASTKWKVRMLKDALEERGLGLPEDTFAPQDLATYAKRQGEARFLTQQLLSSINQFQRESGGIKSETFSANQQVLHEHFGTTQQNYQIDLGQYKRPSSAPNDSQISVGISHQQSQGWLQFAYMPASKKLEDDNRQFFSESALELSSIRLRVSTQTARVKVDEWSIYSMRTLVPYDRYTGGVSSQLRVGLLRHFDDQLQSKLAAEVYTGIGIGAQVSNDILLFSQFNLGAALSDSKAYLYSRPEVGMVIYQVFDMKTLASFSVTHNQRQSDRLMKAIHLQHAVYLSPSLSLNLDYTKRWNSLTDHKTLGISVKYLY